MPVDRHRGHAAASREIKPQHRPVRECQLAVVFLAEQFHTSRRAQLQREIHRAHGMDAPVADLPGAEIEKATPIVGSVLHAIGTHSRVPQPQVPIEVIGNSRFGRRFLPAGRMGAGGSGDMRFGHVADRAGPDNLRSHADAFMRVSLVTHLRGDFVLDGRVGQQARLPGCSGQRFLHVDVLAALHAGVRHCGVHVVGDADGAGVDVLSFFIQHDAEIFVLGRLVEAREVRCGAGFVHVAESHDVLGLGGLVEVGSALAAATDRGDVQLVVIGLVAQGPERRHRTESPQWNGAGEERSKKEMPSGNTTVCHSCTLTPTVSNNSCIAPSVSEGTGSERNRPHADT